MPSISEPADRPLRADAERNRRRILEAAADEFAERGIGVTMDAIAARAGVGVGTVYRRFPEKSELLAALFEEKLLLIAALADEALEREDEPWEALVGFIERGSEFQAENRAMRELLLSGRTMAAPSAPPRAAPRSGERRADIAPLDVPVLALLALRLRRPKRLRAPAPPSDPGSVDDLAQFDPRRRPRRDREPEPGLPAPLEFKPVPPVPLPERGREPRSTLRRPGPR